jgi:hypothetical protein
MQLHSTVGCPKTDPRHPLPSYTSLTPLGDELGRDWADMSEIKLEEVEEDLQRSAWVELGLTVLSAAIISAFGWCLRRVLKV